MTRSAVSSPVRILVEGLAVVPTRRVLAWRLMPNHWHLVVQPRRDGELSLFMRWLTQGATRLERRQFADAHSSPISLTMMRSVLRPAAASMRWMGSSMGSWLSRKVLWCIGRM